QRNLNADDILAGISSDLPLAELLDSRVEDGFEIGLRLVVFENNLAQLGAIDGATLDVDQVLPEAGEDSLVVRVGSVEQLVRKLVGVDHRHAHLSEDLADGRLSASDGPGDCHRSGPLDVAAGG